MPRVVHFEIHADDPQRAANFYQNVFGWQINKWEGPEDYWLVTTGADNEPGINGAIVKRRLAVPSDGVELVPVIAYVCTIDVPDIDEAIAKATSQGAPLALPKMPVPGVGWLAYYKDSEGNIFGMMQTDAAAG